MNKPKLQLLLSGIFVFIALIILIDFTVPGRVINDDIMHVKKERQQYYNAGGNQHYSYQIITPKHHFSVTKDFAKEIKTSQKIEYTVSPIFNEVNRYGLPSSMSKTIYSLRIISGCIIPLIALITFVIAFVFKYNIDILVFVLLVLLVGNLVFLLI
jgi:hypothetical protein